MNTARFKQAGFSRRFSAVLTVAVGVAVVWGAGCARHNMVAVGGTRTDGRYADLVIIGGKIWTADENQPASIDGGPTVVAVVGDRIAAVGDDESIGPMIGPNTRVIRAEGRRVIPGMTDCHTHVISGGFQLSRLMLRDVASRDAFVRAVAERAKTLRAGEWLLGGRWSVDSWPDPRSPSKDWLDPVTGDRPVFLSRMDGHSAVVNSAALRLAGIDRDGPPSPKGGEIERDPTTGEPTGILKESAMGLVSRLIPDPSPAQRDEALRRAMRHANALGVTSVNDMCGLSDLEAFRRAEQSGALTLRITAYLSVSDWGSYADRIPRFGLNSDRLRLAGFKGFMDGSLGSRTAYMHEPFADATPDMPYPRGQLTAMADPPGAFNQLVATADAKGLQLAVHAIGDEANHLLLGAYEYARNRNGERDARHRIEHAQHLQVPDIPRFAELGVVASMQPFHKADDGRYAEKALGKERLKGSYAFRKLVDTGALLVFGSDWPVVTMNPFAGIDAAVNARTLDGKFWLPWHSLTVEESLRAYTIWAARAIHREDRLGSIEVGKYADMVVLSQDPLAMIPQRVGEVQADITILGGKVVFER